MEDLYGCVLIINFLIEQLKLKGVAHLIVLGAQIRGGLPVRHIECVEDVIDGVISVVLHFARLLLVDHLHHPEDDDALAHNSGEQLERSAQGTRRYLLESRRLLEELHEGVLAVRRG